MQRRYCAAHIVMLLTGQFADKPTRCKMLDLVRDLTDSEHTCLCVHKHVCLRLGLFCSIFSLTWLLLRTKMCIQ